MRHSRAVIVTASGKRGFLKTFGIDASEEDENRSPGLAARPI
jgi:hypothetical protein